MILRILLLTILLYLVFILVRNFAASVTRRKDRFARPPGPVKTEDLVQDPYCHRYIPESEALKASLDGQTLYFCSRECLEKYKAGNK
jgi:YHS domain-containing protein